MASAKNGVTGRQMIRLAPSAMAGVPPMLAAKTVPVAGWLESSDANAFSAATWTASVPSEPHSRMAGLWVIAWSSPPSIAGWSLPPAQILPDYASFDAAPKGWIAENLGSTLGAAGRQGRGAVFKFLGFFGAAK